MSGTSVDAIDVAIIHFRVDGRPELKHFREHPMPGELREPILRLAEPGLNDNSAEKMNWAPNGRGEAPKAMDGLSQIDSLSGLDRALGEAIADAVLKTLKDAGISPTEITAIGSHGQTIRHRPHSRPAFTLQIGCPSTISEITGITTVADFRRRDIAAGGEGAPLAPFAHRLLFGDGGDAVAVLNIGGIANISFLPPEGDVLGFDTGPGNMIMDCLMLHLSDGRHGFDRDGQIAAGGTICQPLLTELLEHAFFSRRPPKSTGREDFGQEATNKILAWPDIGDADRLATAAELTARSIADGRGFLPEEPKAWYVCGGGAANRHLMQRLSELLAPATVQSTEALGMPPAAVEAVCFALLGWHTLLGNTNTLPEVTGARHAVCGGHITPGENWSKLLKDLNT